MVILITTVAVLFLKAWPGLGSSK